MKAPVSTTNYPVRFSFLLAARGQLPREYLMILTISDTHICMRLGLHVTMPTRHTSRDRRTVRETRLDWNPTTVDWISQVEKVGRGQSEVDF
jgi:hypothetical protein